MDAELSLEPSANVADDETSLVALLRQRDADAFRILVRRYAGRMEAVARRYLLCEQECADAVQDAFISAFQAIDRFEQCSQLGTWLHRIIVNSCLMKLRSRSRRQETSIEELLPAFDATGHHVEPARRWRTLPEERLEREETRTLVRRCIDMLPEDHRTVLLLRDIEDMNTDEVAQVLEITPGAVKSRLHRARQALRTLLEPYFTA